MEENLSYLELDRINHFVLGKQHLIPDSVGDDIVQIVRDVGGLHATNSTTPYLSLYARCSKFKKEDLNRELYKRRSLGRIRCVRKTIYIHTKDMIPIVWKATASKVATASKRYMEFRGVTDEIYQEVSKEILAMLSDHKMTASQIKEAVSTKVDISSILYYLCDQGLLLRGNPAKGWKDRNYKYCLFSEYFPDIDLEKLSESEAITSLVEKYYTSFGPATENDVVWWTGLGKTEVRYALKNLQDQLLEVPILGGETSFIILKSDEGLIRDMETPDKPTVNLLPTLDPYLMGYKERGRYLAEKDSDLVFDRSGNATSVILVDGIVVGVWDFEGGEESLVKLHIFRKIRKEIHDEIFDRAGSLGRFIAGGEVRIRECESMVPLKQRTAGSLMSPLKDC